MVTGIARLERRANGVMQLEKGAEKCHTAVLLSTCPGQERAGMITTAVT